MSGTRLSELKESVRFGEEDEKWLRAFCEVVAAQRDRISHDIAEGMRLRSGARAWMSIARANQMQRFVARYIDRVCRARVDEAFFVTSTRTGRFLSRIAMPVRDVMRMSSLIRAALDELAEPLEHARETRRALARILDLDHEIMLGAYQDAAIRKGTRALRDARDTLSGALARAEHRYENMVENSRGFFVGLDASGKIRFVNREVERARGLPRKDILGKSFVQALVAEDLRDAQALAIDEVKTARGQIALPSSMPTKQGNLRDVVWYIAYAEPAGGDDVVLFAMGADLTEERAAAERTRQAEKLASVGMLAAGLAHEIRNPLNGALLHVSFLERSMRKEGGHEDWLEGVNVVGEEMKRLAGFVSEFLEFARPEPMHVVRSSIRDVARSAREKVKAHAARTGVTVRLDVPRPEVFFDVDPAKIEQVLVALLRNAVEAVAHHGGGSVELRAKKHPREVVFEVQDDGPGISAEAAAIFDAFYSTKEGGTGLGLAVSHRIVTDHRGTIDVSSKPGETIFRVALPLDHRGENAE